MENRINRIIQEIDNKIEHYNNSSASARKSMGEYKPIIKWSTGRTYVVDQSPWWESKYERGTTFSDRNCAIERAHEHLENDADSEISRLLQMIESLGGNC